MVNYLDILKRAMQLQQLPIKRAAREILGVKQHFQNLFRTFLSWVLDVKLKQK
jgi:hypothetical protein